MKYIKDVTVGQIQAVGLNPFAVKLLAESYALHPDPGPIAFVWESIKNGKPIKIYVRLDPEEPSE